MSHKNGNIVVICPESPQKCEFCGAERECRPYGKGFKQICIHCASKDIASVQIRMHHKLFGVPLPEGFEP